MEPPNFGLNPMRFGKECRSCESLDLERRQCVKYLLSVQVNNVCDSWNRSPAVPPELA